ncbi:hypothetical protein ACS5PK_11170 [Roseateles sp. DB2]|uniref:hypothetical protein n=1 Tax=Roseateles sp. DB2 TaxID=3453717 RepID=UPI003EEBAB1E
MTDNDLKTLWKSQSTDAFTMPLQDIHRRAARFQRQVRLRNLLEYGAGLFVLGGFGYYIVEFTGLLMRAGSVLVMLGALFVLFELHRRGASRQPPGPGLGIASLDFHRAELARQRDALRDVWRWYVAPFIPGVVVFRWGVETELADSPAFAHGTLANVCIALVFSAIVLVNRWSASRLQRQLDELDALAEPAAQQI